MEVTRVDRWLWAVRLYKTRSAATTACRGGHVRVNGVAAKPATPLRAGDRVAAVVGDRLRVLEVVQVIDKRVGAAVAGVPALVIGAPGSACKGPSSPSARVPSAWRRRVAAEPT